MDKWSHPLRKQMWLSAVIDTRYEVQSNLLYETLFPSVLYKILPVKYDSTLSFILYDMTKDYGLL